MLPNIIISLILLIPFLKDLKLCILTNQRNNYHERRYCVFYLLLMCFFFSNPPASLIIDARKTKIIPP